MNTIVIPIKTNNVRLPGKNTMVLGDKPLYKHLFETVKQCNYVDEVFVDSSDEQILDVARKNNFKCIKRPESLNGPGTSGNDLIAHQLNYVKTDIFGQFFVTTPFLKQATIDKAFSIMEEETIYTSCFGLYPVHDRYWLGNNSGNYNPINHTRRKLVGTQYMKPLMREAGFYLFKPENFKEEYSRITLNYKTFTVSSEECIDIDTKLDFLYAEAFYNSTKNENKKI